MNHRKLENYKAVLMAARDIGFETEGKDCMVKAIQAVTGVPYRDAHVYVATRFCRRWGKGTHNVSTVLLAMAERRELIFGYRVIHPGRLGETVVKGAGIRRTWRGLRYVSRYATLAQFVDTHKTGRFICWSCDHAFAVVEGVIYDSGYAGPRTQVTGFYEMRSSSACETTGI